MGSLKGTNTKTRCRHSDHSTWPRKWNKPLPCCLLQLTHFLLSFILGHEWPAFAKAKCTCTAKVGPDMLRCGNMLWCSSATIGSATSKDMGQCLTPFRMPSPLELKQLSSATFSSTLIQSPSSVHSRYQIRLCVTARKVHQLKYKA